MSLLVSVRAFAGTAVVVTSAVTNNPIIIAASDNARSTLIHVRASWIWQMSTLRNIVRIALCSSFDQVKFA
jgi:hypothetical protein